MQILHPSILDSITMESVNTFTMETHKPSRAERKAQNVRKNNTR